MTMPRTFQERHSAAVYLDGMLRHSSNYFDSEARRLHFRKLHPEIFERPRIVPYPMQKGISPIGWLRRARE